jgi:hypothetical protein
MGRIFGGVCIKIAFFTGNVNFCEVIFEDGVMNVKTGALR